MFEHWTVQAEGLWDKAKHVVGLGAEKAAQGQDAATATAADATDQVLAPTRSTPRVPSCLFVS